MRGKGLTLLASVMLLVLASVAFGAGSFAYFSDIETSTGNSFTAGTLDLQVNWGNEAVTTCSVSDVVPGYEEYVDNSYGYGFTKLFSRSSIMGELDIALSDITNDDNGLTDPESDVDSTGGPGEGELGDYMEMALWIDRAHKTDGIFDGGDIQLLPDGTTVTYSGSPLTYYTANSYSGVSWDAAEEFGGGHWSCFYISWRVPKAVGNVIQSDSITFDVTFTLQQPEED